MTLALLLAAALAADPAAPAVPAVPPLASPPVPAAAAELSPAAELSLADALAELDRQSPTLRQARARAGEASALTRQATAGLLPGLSLSATYLRNSDEKVVTLPPSVSPDPLVLQPLNSFSGTLALRVPILVPTAWFEAGAARHAARGAAAQAQAARLGLRASLAATAHLGVASEEALAATERAVANAARLAESAERRLEAGTAAPLDALRARTEEVRRQGDLVRVRADLERVRLALGTLLGREGPVRILVTSTSAEAVSRMAAHPEPFGSASPARGYARDRPRAEGPESRETPTSTRDETALVAEALAHRPELTAASAQVSAAGSQLDAAWARLAPQLSATGAVFAADVPYPTGERDGWRVTVDLTWPLYDGGLRYGKRREAEARLEQARAGEAAQRLAVGQEARDAARDEAVAVERLRLAGQQRRLAAEAAATAQRSYQAGLLSSLDVVDMNDRLYAADIGLAEAGARLATARLALQRALGREP